MNSLRRILLVEDNPHDVELSLAALAESNLANKVDVTRNGAEALDYLFRRGEFTARDDVPPAVVLLDLKMPKVDGLEVLAEIRASDRLKFTPVVMMTSSREECDLVESYKRGANAYMVKPIAFPQFVHAVKQLGMFWALLNESPCRTSAADPAR